SALGGACIGIWNGDGIGGGALWAGLGLVLGIPLGMWYLALTNWYRQRRHPRGAQLACTKDGLDFLVEGERLHWTREWLSTQDGPDEQLEERWQHQLDLERELRVRQDQLLANSERGA
ncbi:MAG: hypothetical protein WC654_04435, partial [Patescibacteria group bacterium]